MRVALLVFAFALSGCARYESYQLSHKCKDLIDRSLASPSSAKYLDSQVFRRVQSGYRLPDDMPDTEQIKSDLEELKFDIRSAEILDDAEEMQRLQTKLVEIKERNDKAAVLLKEVKNKPWAEIYWELDAQNRSGTTLRMLGVCTFLDDGTQQSMDSTLQLSSLEEGRIPRTAPPAFGH